MIRPLIHLDRDTVDALRMVDGIATFLTMSTWVSQETLDMVMEHIISPRFNNEEEVSKITKQLAEHLKSMGGKES